MTLAELLNEVSARGCRIPGSFRDGGSGRGHWRDLLGFTPGRAGYPGRRVYTERHLRLVIAWVRVTELTGHAGGQPRTIRKAARMLAAAPDGYVYISEGRVGWSLVPPIQALRHGAVCWPVQP